MPTKVGEDGQGYRIEVVSANREGWVPSDHATRTQGFGKPKEDADRGLKTYREAEAKKKAEGSSKGKSAESE